MPHTEKQIAADNAAIVAGRCPECGNDLARVDPRAHAGSHWPDLILFPEVHADAIRRRDLVLNFKHKGDS